jgi:hypothetical protein
MNEDTARAVLEPLLSSYQRMNQLAADVFEHGSYPQALEFRKVAGQVMADIVTGCFMPLFHRFPHLQPEEFKGEFEAPPTLPVKTIREIQEALHTLSSQLASIETRLRRETSPEEADSFLSHLHGLADTIALGQLFIDRALKLALDPPHWWPKGE